MFIQKYCLMTRRLQLWQPLHIAAALSSPETLLQVCSLFRLNAPYKLLYRDAWVTSRNTGDCCCCVLLCIMAQMTRH